MNQKIKRLLSMILAVSMVFGMLILPVSAAEPETAEAAQQTEDVTVQETAEAEEPAEETGAEPAAAAEQTAEAAYTAVAASEDAHELLGGETITEGGVYQLTPEATGVITIGTTEPVTIVGNGLAWDEYYNPTTAGNEQLSIDCTVEGVSLTIQDLYIFEPAEGYNSIDFMGLGNELILAGMNMLDNNLDDTLAAIHVPSDASLTISGEGTMYLYKTSFAAGIGGNISEKNGEITIDSGTIYAKGSRTGATIGSGQGVPGGTVTINDGNIYLLTKARGAAIGGGGYHGVVSENGGMVTINGGTVMVVCDWSGAAIGIGGDNVGSGGLTGGTLVIRGGSVKCRINSNAYGQWGLEDNGESYMITNLSITADKRNGSDEPVYLLTLPLDGVTANTEGDRYVVLVDGAPFYSGSGYTNTQKMTTATIDCWPVGDPENCLYLYLTGEDHTLNINGNTVTYYWNEENQTFSSEKLTRVNFCLKTEGEVTEENEDGTVTVTTGLVDLTGAEIVVSEGTGYTYRETTYEGIFREAEDGTSTRTTFLLAPGLYTFTITKDGYYASTGSFQVTEEGHAVSIASDSNLNAYLKDDIFTIPMTPFVKSTNANAWDGVTLDVSWYDPSASEYHIKTPAQLEGLAAIINGIYNAEITTIIDDADGNGVTETYTPAAYARLENRKIIAATAEGTASCDDFVPGSLNMITTLYYWYGVTGELDDTGAPVPADFKDKTVYLDADLDMGGYQTADGTWTGARYMTIGGQSLMHYIDYGTCTSDGYSHIGTSFNGTFDGQGHIVYNLYCDRYAAGKNYGDSSAVALIGLLGRHSDDPRSLYADSPTVRNVAVDGWIRGRRSIGGIVGKTRKSYNGTLIENCVNFADISNTDAKGVGGIVGAGWDGGMIRNCANFGNVYTAYKNAGGIAGSNESELINCYNVGYIDAWMYEHAQALGTDNGGGEYVNVYWLTGSSLADSVESFLYPAVYQQSAADTITEIGSFAGFTTEEFLTSLNGDFREWVFAGENDFISRFLAQTTFKNCKLDTEGVTAAGMPVPRCFTADTTTVTDITKTADPTVLTYVEGQTFDTTGLMVWATWSDNTKELLEEFTLSIDRPLEAEDTEITVSGTVGGQSFSYTFAITVIENELSSLDITTNPTNILYASDETFDPAGMIVKAIYSAAPTTKVTLDASEYTWALEGNVLAVSYTFGGKTMTDTVELTLLDTPAPTQNADGAYQLTSANDLLWFANQVKALKRVELDAVVMNDITASNSFTGIGSSSAKYAGNFDGQGHTLTLDIEVYGCAGLFAFVNGATIRNVTVAGSVVSTNSSSGVAGIVGNADKEVTVIENCVNKAGITGTSYVAGIVGKTNKVQLTIRNCVNEGTITASNKYAGGIVGNLLGDSAVDSVSCVTDCVNYGDVTASDICAGGIAGVVKYADITRCVNEGDVEGKYDVGGIAGSAEIAADLLSSCRNKGAVKATGSLANHGVGGIVGLALCDVKDVYNQGDVSASDESAVATYGVGGIIGTIGNHYVVTNGIANAYNQGAVSGAGSASVGSVAGYVCYTSVLSNCFYLEDTAAVAVGSVNSMHAVTGEPAAETEASLKERAEDLGEGFKADSVCPPVNGGYPVLAWETIGGDHSWEESSVTAPATCTQSGEAVYTCHCGATKTEVIEALGHSYESGICKVCGVKDPNYSKPAVNPFVDVKKGEFYYDAVLWAAENEITAGYGSETTFCPEVDCTRAQVVTFLWRAAGCPAPQSSANPFTDIQKGWYYDAVLWAKEQGITAGYGSTTTFCPDQECSRAEIVTFLHRYAGTPAPASTNNPFVDVPAGEWYTNAVLWAVEEGITNGYGSETTFAPNKVCTRGQIVTFLYRAEN